MKKIITLIFFSIATYAVNGQEKKDSMLRDTAHLEKINKMPMDTVHYKPRSKPVLPEEQKDKKKDDPTAPIGHKRKSK